MNCRYFAVPSAPMRLARTIARRRLHPMIRVNEHCDTVAAYVHAVFVWLRLLVIDETRTSRGSSVIDICRMY
jgi:hypothetical protein